MAENTEKFIETVRNYAFLYDTAHEYYKNVLKKAEAWNEIAENLRMTAESAKQKWKNLRDSYMKYKKFTKGETGQAKKYHKWPWSIHMQFLDYTLKPRSHSSNVPSQSLTETEETQLSEAENFPMTDDDTQQTSASGEQSPTPLQMPPPQKEKKMKSRSHTSTQNCSDDVDKVIDFLANKRRKPDIDGTDHLFLSYAETFKKLQPMTQAILKIELATLFSRAEMNELNAQLPPATSPAYSQSSSASSSYHPQFSNSTTQSQILANPIYHDLTCSGESSRQSTAPTLFSARDVYEKAGDSKFWRNLQYYLNPNLL